MTDEFDDVRDHYRATGLIVMGDGTVTADMVPHSNRNRP